MKIECQLQKIDFYFQEGQRIWNTAPEQVVSRQFYELWENIQHPLPFTTENAEIELLGFKFELPDSSDQPWAYFCWDDQNGCAALQVECAEWKKKYLLCFSDGLPLVSEEETIFSGLDEINHGEKLEVIYDLIAHIRKTSPNTDIIEIKKKDFIVFLDQIGEIYDRKIVNSMRQMTLPFMKNMLKQALADFAVDEIGAQLSLPIGGDYSREQDLSPACSIRNLCNQVPAETGWTIKQNLNFLLKACRLKVQNESEFVFTFEHAEVLQTGQSEIAIKLRIAGDAPLRHGDILNIAIRGEKLLFGTFRVDIFDGDAVLGRLRCDDTGSFIELKKRLYGVQQKSPSAFIASMVEELISEIEKGADNIGVLAEIIGLCPIVFDLSNPSELHHEMDHSQHHAWSVATNPENHLTLIQGPPGTGKTYVLEQTIKEFCRRGMRVLVAAPSNAAVDNICRRLEGFPLLRLGKNVNSIAPDVATQNWIGEQTAIMRFVEMRRRNMSGSIYAGTHVGLLREDIIADDIMKNGLFDVIVFDEAGMAGLDEFLLCAKLAKRAVLFGDHQQLPPFPLPQEVLDRLYKESGPVTDEQRALVSRSALEWLIESRGCPVIMLQRSYRCQNPRLLRFSSTLFYDAAIRPSRQAEYYQLSYQERQLKFSAGTLRFYSTSALPPELRHEQLFFEGQKPGIANRSEAIICTMVFYEALKRYQLEEVTMIAPYRKQVMLIRSLLSRERASEVAMDSEISADRWDNFLNTRVATVDSFQGGESDMVIICYVRSNDNGSIGFIDNPNRINVAHTRCRRELGIVGDLVFLKKNSKNKIFERMARAFRRDGEIVEVRPEWLAGSSAGQI